MQPLNKEYLKKLETLKKEIQESEELKLYLEEEEEEYYARLKEMFEPRIALLFEEVASENPLQLVSFEEQLLDPMFEGLYLPKILGHSVLRGELTPNLKYARPQSHFKAVLMAICNSANFDILRKRIGQSIQMGFSLSSDIWITNLINEVENKRIRYFLQSQKLEKYRHTKDRRAGYERYKRQFINDNFQTAEFPENLSRLKTRFSALKHFLIYRIDRKGDNTSLVEPIRQFIANKSFHGTNEHMQLMVLFGGFFELSEKDHDFLAKHLNGTRKKTPEFAEQLLQFVLEMHQDADINFDPVAEQRLSTVIHKSIKDEVTEYFNLMDVVHAKGYNSEEAQEAVKVFYNKHEGLSLVNECLRQAIFSYFARLISNLEVSAYSDLFEISKVFSVYMGIFSNQQFNQDLEDLSMKYVRRLLRHYTDKRGKDYQDIKKFVSTTFLDLNFLSEKEIVELFKSRRKRKKEA